MTDLETTRIPGIDRDVCRVALGTWSMGGWMWGGADERAAVATIERALDLGINLIDTAPAYGFGLSERLIGQVLTRRGIEDEVVVATKCGLSWGDDEEPYRDSSPARVRQEITESLKRLGKGRVDLYQVHWPDPETPIEDTALALEALVAEGLAGTLGVCNYSAEQAEVFARAAPLSAMQSPYNLLLREAETDAVAHSRSRGLTFLAYSPLARGLLTGTWTADQEHDDEARRKPMYHGTELRVRLEAVGRLDAYARERFGRRVIHLAVRWVLDRVPGSVVLWGARRPEQLHALPGVWGWSLDEGAMKEIDAILADTLGGRTPTR